MWEPVVRWALCVGRFLKITAAKSAADIPVFLNYQSNPGLIQHSLVDWGSKTGEWWTKYLVNLVFGEPGSCLYYMHQNRVRSQVTGYGVIWAKIGTFQTRTNPVSLKSDSTLQSPALLCLHAPSLSKSSFKPNFVVDIINHVTETNERERETEWVRQSMRNTQRKGSFL